MTSSQATSAGDAEAVRHLEQAIGSGKHWYIALLEAMGLWASAEETYDGNTYLYLIAGEAFDWLLLAERLCRTVDNLLPEDEKDTLLFRGRPPLDLSPKEVKGLIGGSKYGQYLNYFYGVTVEASLVLAVKEEVHKERWLPGRGGEEKIDDEAYRRIYGATKAELLKRFRREKGYPQRRSMTLSLLKEFTYWLFKHRLKECEKARVASDTRKGLTYLRRQWSARGPAGLLSASESFGDGV